MRRPFDLSFFVKRWSLHRGSSIELRRVLRLAQSVGTGEIAVEDIEAAILREDHHEIIDLFKISLLRISRVGLSKGGSKKEDRDRPKEVFHAGFYHYKRLIFRHATMRH